MIRRITLPALLLWTCLAACVSGSEGDDCTSDRDCEENLSCFAGSCLELGRPEGRIAWQIIPQIDSGLPPTVFGTIGNPLTFHLCEQPPVVGDLAFSGGARVVAVGELGGIPGACSTLERSVGRSFSLPLPAGIWRLHFHPGDGSPPIVRRIQVTRCQPTDLGEVGHDDVLRTLRFLPVHDAERDPRPTCGLRARIVDPASGLALSAPVELASDEGRCMAPPGGLRLDFTAPEGATHVALRLEPLVAGDPAFRGRELRLELPDESEWDLGPVSVGDQGVERVLVTLRDPAGHPVGDAKLQALWPPPPPVPENASCFAGRQPPGEDGSFFASSLALPGPERGIYELWLPPGPYLLHASAPEAARLASGGSCGDEGSSCLIEVRPERTMRFTLDLEARVPLHGRVQHGQNVLLPGARVIAKPRTGGIERASTSDATGRYELLLDPGNYDLLVQPGRQELPWALLPLLSPLVAPRELTLSVPRGALVAGKVLQGDELPVREAVVRAYRLDLPTPTLAGEAITARDGTFRLSLPSR